MNDLFLYKPRVKMLFGRMWADNPPGYWVDSFTACHQYTQMILGDANNLILTDKAFSSWHEMGRNQLCDAARTLKAEWLVMFDTDHRFRPDLIVRMHRLAITNGLRVLSAIYQYKFPPHTPVGGQWAEPDKLENGNILPIASIDFDQSIMQVGVVPGGCLMIHASTLREIAAKLNEPPFNIIQGLSEDYSFCYRCRKLGIPIHLAPQIECHHVIPNTLSVRDFYENPKEPNATLSSISGE